MFYLRSTLFDSPVRYSNSFAFLARKHAIVLRMGHVRMLITDREVRIRIRIRVSASDTDILTARELHTGPGVSAALC